MAGAILSGALPGAAVTRRFDDTGDFAAGTAAERYLEERGFSVGRRQRADPRGILYGAYDIQKWRNLRPIERVALHGQMTGDGRNGPVVIALFDTAPAEAVAAFRSAAPTRQPRILESIGDVAALAVVALSLAGLLLAWNSPWSRPKPPIIGDIVVGKHTNRAGPIGLRAAAREAQR